MRTTLYGGAFTVELPSYLIDVSNLRQVPDTQEVFIIEGKDKDHDRSLIIDLLEKVPHEYHDAIKLHVEDLLDSEVSNHLLLTETQKNLDTEAYLSFAFKDNIIVLIGLIRIDRVDTDLVISINIPLQEKVNEKIVADAILESNTFPKESTSHIIQESFKILQTAVLSLEISDWSIFGL